ncbi:MAG: RNA 2'-phosphotransferase [Firmicutes bacterium]|nr:RNA 2'-phosphotransferase [Bacillota bacterium]
MDYTKLSKEISYALRHAPWEYELELDSEGFVPIQQLIEAINESGNYNRPITKSDLEHIIETSEKKRHEIQNDSIRALYGHTVSTHIKKNQIKPPDILYHGTSHKAFEQIMSNGLKPMKRQYVHLSVDTDTAIRVGKRRDIDPIILKINAAKAYQEGIVFYEGNDKVILADFVPTKYIAVF